MPSIEEIEDIEDIEDKVDLPNVSILTITRNRKAFLPLMLKNWNDFSYPKDKLEWIILDDGTEDLSDGLPAADNIKYIKLSRPEIKKFIDMIDLSYLSKDKDKQVLSKKALGGAETDEKAELIQQYYKKTCRLPIGFKRDYGINLCSHDFIMHMDDDDYYPPDCIQLRLSFLDERRRIQCIYTSEIDTYTIKTAKLERLGLPKFCNEATLFHTKEYWNTYKFKWEDIYNEGKHFIHGHMEARIMPCKDMIVNIIHDDNYSMRNMKAVEDIKDEDLTAFNWEDIRECMGKISPEVSLLDLYDKKTGGTILSINSDSDILNNLVDKYEWKNLQLNPAKKFREKEILKTIKKTNPGKIHYDLMIMGCKQPIWTIFDKHIFSVILLENRYNLNQVDGILTQKGYMPITLGKMCCYVAKMYLKTEQVLKKEGPPTIGD
jgi:glycosyltransferase involved in cell wall biosynthesis